MKFKITWLSNGFVQIHQLVSHKCQFKSNYGYFTIYSPIYRAIENESYCLDLGYGKHYFQVEQI